MKKFIALLLALLLILSVTGCAKKEPDETLNPSTENTEAPLENTEKEETEDKKEDTPKNPEKENASSTKTETVYDLKCRASSEISWKTVNLNDAVTNSTVTLSVPSDWSLSQSDTDAYTISRGGKKIGDIKSLTFAAPKKELDKVSKTQTNLTYTKQISLHNTGGDTYYHSFAFKTTRKNPNFEIYLRVHYTELDSAAADKLYNSVSAVTDYVNYTFPDISKANSSKKIVAFGNSFIGHSRVAAILDEMLSLDGSGFSATSVTIANSAATAFMQRTDLLSLIEKGEYCCVIQSGFYESIENITALATIKAACDKSGTKLVVMPAHNEDPDVITVAASKFYDVPFLNWKGQLDSLIASGVARSDLCTDDNVKHCKPLAGYVAAFMLYRNMFGKNPPAISDSIVPKSEVAKLSSFTSSYTPPKSAPRPTFTGETYVID